MRTQKQINASRSNGARPKGPATPEGKALSSQNAVRHGLSSKVVVLSNENQDDFNQVLESYLAHWSPVTQPEIDLVHDIAAARWRLNRVLALEAASLDLEMDKQRAHVERKYSQIDEPVRSALAFNTTDTDRALNSLGRHESRLQRTITRATAELLKLKKERSKQENQNCANEPKNEQLPPPQPDSDRPKLVVVPSSTVPQQPRMDQRVETPALARQDNRPPLEN